MDNRVTATASALVVIVAAAGVAAAGSGVGDVNINMMVVVMGAAVFFVNDGVLLAFAFTALLAAMRWQPALGMEDAALTVIVAGMMLIRPRLPLHPFAGSLALVALGTAAFTAIVNPALIARAPSLIAFEIAYNVIAGCGVYILLALAYGKPLPSTRA
ncbi:MAG: hypothetical protein HYS43_01175 [Candidatus Liptonbacteria bacterium]|nr:hypothetical protein [Candidatus Liptonbacteria bacterium]